MNHMIKTDESDTTETVTDEDEETLNSSVRVNDKEEEEDLGKVPQSKRYSTSEKTLTVPQGKLNSALGKT
jgi:hypothetical protein